MNFVLCVQLFVRAAGLACD